MGARLTLWYSLVLLAGLALFGGGIWLVVAHSLTVTINETLAAQAKGVATVLQTEYQPGQPAHLQEELSEYAEATPEGKLIEVRDPADPAPQPTSVTYPPLKRAALFLCTAQACSSPIFRGEEVRGKIERAQMQAQR